MNQAMTGTIVDGYERAEQRQRPAPVDTAPSPTVSIIMANYNGAQYIDGALASALSQTALDFEIVIADDASTDDSADRVAEVASRDPRVRLIRSAVNLGPAGARNLCLQAARGRWLAVMDSDDLMHPDRLAHLVAAAERDGADIIADDLLIFHDDPDIQPQTCLRGQAAEAPFWVSAADYVRANVLFSGAQALGYLKPLIRASLIRDRDARYETTLRIAEDYDFILRLLLDGARFRVYPQLLYFYRKHPQSISHRLSRATLVPMLAAHDRLQAATAGRERQLDAAMTTRRASLQKALDFDDLVSGLKRRAWPEVLRLALRRPLVAALLRQPLIDRLRRLGVRRAARPAATRRQVSVLSRQRVIGNTNGSSAYLLSLCAAMRDSGCDVHLVCPSPVVFGRWPWMSLQPEMAIFDSIIVRGSLRVGSRLIATDPRIAARAFIGLLGKLASRIGFPAARLNRPAPFAVSQPWTRPDLLFVARHCRGRADVVVADYAFLTAGIPYALSPKVRSCVVMHDLFSSRAPQFGRLGASDSVTAIEREQEMALLGKADVVIAIQDHEAAIVLDCLPDRRVITAPIAITPVAEPQPGRDRVVLFVGSGAAPNVIGLRWFLDSVWPAVRASLPDVVLQVAGSVCGAIGTCPDGVERLGLVADLAERYQQAGVVISPLLAGSGLKIKLIEALGHGKAMVATGVTLQGVEQAVGDAVVMADDPDAFAASVVRLLEDAALRTAYATAALGIARTHFSAAACYGELLSFVSSASAGGAGNGA